MPETELHVQVRVKGQTDFYFESTGPNPTLPRVGEYIEFADGVGRVDAVTWKPDLASPGDMLIVVECVRDFERKPIAPRRNEASP